MIIGVILLAAGRSTRFGSCKPLAKLPDGETLVSRCYNTFEPHCDKLICVVGDEFPELTDYLDERDFETVYSSRACEGMAYSIRSGIESLIDCDGWLIALADMPFIQSETIEKIIAEFRYALSQKKPVIIQPVFDDTDSKPGHPVGFSSHFVNLLLELEGDSGARAVIKSHPEALIKVRVNDRGVILDADTPQQLKVYSTDWID